MKTMSLLLLSVSVFQGVASADPAYRCESACVAIQGQQVYLLGSVTTESTASKAENFEDLRKLCENRAARWGLFGTIVNRVAWTTYRDQQLIRKVSIFSVDLTPATPRSCEEDPSFDPNQAPYYGDLPLQG